MMQGRNVDFHTYLELQKLTTGEILSIKVKNGKKRFNKTLQV
jgi:hypothetical protein